MSRSPPIHYNYMPNTLIIYYIVIILYGDTSIRLKPFKNGHFSSRATVPQSGLDNPVSGRYIRIMIYETETYRRERPNADKITHLPTGKIYETMGHACLAAGVSLYKMRKLIYDGTIWSRPSGHKVTRKRVRCVETGVTYDSVAEAARAHDDKPSRMSAHLSGRVRSVRGFHFEYTGDHTPPRLPRKRRKQRQSPPDTSPVRDDTGRRYKGVNHVARETGLTRREVVERLRLDPEGIFRTAWVNDTAFRIARHDGSLWWVNGSIPADTFRKFQTILRLAGKHVTAGEARKLTGDLFK